MTDREFLEAAARAAGLVLDLQRIGTAAWNPLADDGDALRLAVKLGISIEFGYCKDDAPVVWCSHEFGYRERTPNFPDSAAATRRAIVRAAAAIGSGR